MVAVLVRPALLPRHLAGAGVLMLGIAWSLGTALAHWGQIRAAGLPLANAVLLVTGGGMLTVAGVWFGAGAVTWAIGRLLGGGARFRAVLFAVSAAAPPLWVAAPALALILADPGPVGIRVLLMATITVGVAGFLASLVAALGDVEDFSWQRACCCTAVTAVFCTSYLSLQ